jgi:hypothetical protein
MLTHLEFRSDKFPSIEGEDQLVNPGVWGKRLADYLREGLHREGIEAGEPIAEDWGWVLPLTDDPFGVWVGCSNYGESPDRFWCFLHPHKISFRRLLSGKAELQNWVSALRQAIDKVLNEDSGVHFCSAEKPNCKIGFRHCGRQSTRC